MALNILLFEEIYTNNQHPFSTSELFSESGKTNCGSIALGGFWRPFAEVGQSFIFSFSFDAFKDQLAVGKNISPSLSLFPRLLRASVLDFACSMGDSESLNNASQLFSRWLEGGT